MIEAISFLHIVNPASGVVVDCKILHDDQPPEIIVNLEPHFLKERERFTGIIQWIFLILFLSEISPSIQIVNSIQRFVCSVVH
jgi:hypothetical protein